MDDIMIYPIGIMDPLDPVDGGSNGSIRFLECVCNGSNGWWI